MRRGLFSHAETPPTPFLQKARWLKAREQYSQCETGILKTGNWLLVDTVRKMCQGNLNENCNFKLRNHSCMVTKFFMGTNLTEMAIDSSNFRGISQLLQNI